MCTVYPTISYTRLPLRGIRHTVPATERPSHHKNNSISFKDKTVEEALIKTENPEEIPEQSCNRHKDPPLIISLTIALLHHPSHWGRVVIQAG